MSSDQPQADQLRILTDAELQALWAATEQRTVSPYPAQAICLGYHGDADTAAGREWWWFYIDGNGSTYARCQDAAKIDLGWFRPRLRLVRSD